MYAAAYIGRADTINDIALSVGQHTDTAGKGGVICAVSLLQIIAGITTQSIVLIGAADWHTTSRRLIGYAR